MNSHKYYCGIIIVTLIYSSLLFAQQQNWSQNDKNQLSPYEVYLEVQDENNRITNKTSQYWNSGSSTWENDGQSIYEYSYYLAALGYYGLAYYYYYYYYTGIWIPGYYYHYYYNAMGYLSGYDYYGRSNDTWVLYGSAVYSDHNSWGDWGTETYSNIDPASGRESHKESRYFDGYGNVTDVYREWWDGSSYNNLWWANTTWLNGYYEKKTYYDWNNGWVASESTNFAYVNGYGSQVGQSNGYLYKGSPSSWTKYMWSNNAWNPYEHCSYSNQDGYTTRATRYMGYDHTTGTWLTPRRQTDYDYFLNGTGKATNQMNISESRLKLVERAEPGADAGEWVNSSRVLMSYENEGYKVGTENEASNPNNILLEQNYPNPFNPETTINFTLAEDSNVKLTIYDMSGRLINELVNTDLNIGNHSINWNGLDLNRMEVVAGIYLYTLKVDDNIQTKKMILMK